MAGYAFARRGLDAHGARVVHFQLRSRDVGRVLSETAVVPRGGGRGRALLVLLHWRGGRPDWLLSNQLFAGLATDTEATGGANVAVLMAFSRETGDGACLTLVHDLRISNG